MGPIRVVSLNTWKCEGDYERRLRLMADGLKAQAADLVLLQEVFATLDGTINTGSFVAEHLQMHCCFQPGRRKVRSLKGNDVKSYSGLAILSRYPYEETGALALPEDGRDGDRWAHWLRVHIDGHTILVINTHLSHLEDREDLRRQQLESIVAFASTCPGDHLVILGGDFNSRPGDPAMNWLDSQQLFPGRNAWLAAPYLQAMGTLVEEGGQACIDHLFSFTPCSDQAGIRWSTCFVALNEPDGAGNYPSDHLAVVAELACLGP